MQLKQEQRRQRKLELAAAAARTAASNIRSPGSYQGRRRGGSAVLPHTAAFSALQIPPALMGAAVPVGGKRTRAAAFDSPSHTFFSMSAPSTPGAPPSPSASPRPNSPPAAIYVPKGGKRRNTRTTAALGWRSGNWRASGRGKLLRITHKKKEVLMEIIWPNAEVQAVGQMPRSPRTPARSSPRGSPRGFGSNKLQSSSSNSSSSSSSKKKKQASGGLLARLSGGSVRRSARKRG
jgi:hypothetical protein